MEQTKMETINNLYALRAGLSVISRSRDQVKICDDKRRRENSNLQSDFFSKQDSILGSLDRHEMRNLRCDWDCDAAGRHKKISEALDELECSLKIVQRRTLLYGICAVVFAVMATISLLCPIALVELSLVAEIWLYILSGGLYIASVFTVYIFSMPLRCAAEIKRDIARVKALPKPLDDLFSWYEQNITTVKNKYLSLINPVYQMSGALYKTLQGQFAGLIDERDWQYLDLIIFYLETGRADTMKEALQLVEREMQSQHIIAAIQEATERICSTMRVAAERISAQLGEISSQLQLITVQQQMQIGQNSRLIAAADMQNALLAKANTSMEQIMQDVSYMRNISIVHDEM